MKRLPLHTFLVLLVFFLLFLPSCQPLASQQAESVRVGLPALEQNALIYIAEEQGYFKQNGLNVTIEDHDSGVSSLQALLKSEVELAVAAEFPVVRARLESDQVAVMASIDKFENDFIVARNDHNITQISDLKGKRIGITLHTINEFYLARFLELNGLQPEDVTLVDLKPAEFVDTISSGQVDALIAWQPYIQQVEQKVDNVVTWPAQSNQLVYGLLVSRQAWLAEHPQAAIHFLESLLQAENYLAGNPQAAKEIVQKRLDYTADYVLDIWPDHEFTLTLDNSLIVAMNDEVRWLIRSGQTAITQAPEFYDAVYLDSLKAVKPEAVTIIH